jgi:hypothetical protein
LRKKIKDLDVPWFARRRSAEAGDRVTLSLGGPRFGDTMGSIARGLTGRMAALSLALLAILAGAATYAWLAGFVPAYFQHQCWMTAFWSPTWCSRWRWWGCWPAG